MINKFPKSSTPDCLHPLTGKSHSQPLFSLSAAAAARQDAPRLDNRRINEVNSNNVTDSRLSREFVHSMSLNDAASPGVVVQINRSGRTEIVSRSQDVTVQEGMSAILSCRLRNHQYTKITWRKTEPDAFVVRQDEKFDVSMAPNGEARLIVKNTRASDSGLYVCYVENSLHQSQNLQCTIGLSVVASPTPIHDDPILSIVNSTTVKITWSPPNPCIVEYCQIGSSDWVTETKAPVLPSYEVGNLLAGETYSFRLVNPTTGLTGVSSLSVTLPTNDMELWQQQHFSHRYTIVSELGRGKSSVVRLARDTGTGQLVASKQISRNFQSFAQTQAEYKVIAAIQHTNIVKGLCLYQNAPHPGTDTIVMEYVHGPYLLSYICKNEEYTETTVQFFMKQLLHGISWLHSRKILHLDIKSENILVDVSNIYSPVLKIIDFGNHVRYELGEKVPANNLEFVAPEVVADKPLSGGTDMWSVGVFLYVFLSGVSPFLDDSEEETSANILKGDYCFPEDYFRGISAEAIVFVQKLLVLNPEERLTVDQCLAAPWIVQVKAFSCNFLLQN
uniref:Uncharacterized protein n=1 Tax=Lutzomyia longipalpis TaxID=7200 RepID=A0A1B0EX37_LUTLO